MSARGQNVTKSITRDTSTEGILGSEYVAVQVHRGLSELWKEDTCTDFEIETNRKTFRCHKVVLASVSDYFKAMFSSGMRETELNRATFDDIDADTFETFFNILYCVNDDGSPFLGKSDEEMERVFNLAVRLQTKFLENICAEYFKETMADENCVERWKLGRTVLCGEVSIAVTAWEYITNNLMNFIDSSSLLSLDYEDFKLIIQNEDLVVKQEVKMWELVKAWVDADREKRICHIGSLLKHCCLTEIDRDYLVEEMAFHPLIRESESGLQLVQEAIKFQNHPGSHENMELKFRACHGKVKSLVQLYKTEGKNIDDYFKDHTEVSLAAWCRQEWQDWPGLDNVGQYIAGCVHRDSMYVLSGVNTSYRRASFFEYNGHSQKWVKLREMPVPLVGHTMSALNNSICVLGGRSHTQQNLRVHQYSLAGKGSNDWCVAGELMAPVMNASSVSHGNKVYIFGGEIEGMAADCIQVYDPQTKSGTIYSNLPKPCRWSRAVCRGTHAYLITVSGDILHVSLDNGTSKVVGSIPNFYRINFGIGLSDGKLAVYGGKAIANMESDVPLDSFVDDVEWTASDEVHVFDVATGIIEDHKPLPEAREIFYCGHLVHTIKLNWVKGENFVP